MKQYIKRRETKRMMKTESRMGISIVLLVISLSLAVLTYTSNQFTNPFMRFLSSQHVWIMVLLVIISISFGYIWATSLSRKLAKEKENAEKLNRLLRKFITPEERITLEMLRRGGNRIPQNKLSKHEKMTRVKAHRTVKSLEERGVVTTEKIGKRVYIELKE